MTIILNGNTFKYEIENVCKLFFPGELFEFEYENKGSIEDNTILAELEKKTYDTKLCVTVKLNSKEYNESSTVANAVPKYDAECERCLAVAVYSALSAAIGKKISWGVMTGIRPVKQLNFMLEHGSTIEQAEKIFSKKYLVSDEKINLCKKVLANQIDVIKDSKENSYSLYVAIPFCPSRCSYCSFVSSAISSPKAKMLVEPYLSKLCEEIRLVGKMVVKLNLSLETVYIGGGTPTVLSANQLKILTDCMNESFPISTAREYTIEAGRADSITEEKLAVIKASGATRISINPQTFNDDVLKKIGRQHTGNDVIEIYNLAQNMGLDDVNMDFIAGLPGDTLYSFCNTVDTAVKLSPTNITVHTLTVKRSSDLFHSQEFNQGANDGDVSKMVDYAYKKLTANGYEPYYLYRQKNTLENLENIGYCKKGFEGIYNIYIMEEIHSILALGAGAVSKLIRASSQKIQRIFNYKYPFEYIDDFESILSRKEKISEFYNQFF